MSKKVFYQEEINQIVSIRLKRERERIIKEFDDRFKRCMTSIHLLMRQEMCEMKRIAITEGNDKDNSSNKKVVEDKNNSYELISKNKL